MIEETINHKGRPMTAKLTALSAWNSLPPNMSTDALYAQLGDAGRQLVDSWFDEIVADINGEKGEEIERLKARIAELERTASTSPPKPRRTAGQKLCDALVKIGQSFSWAEYDDKNKERMQSAAIELGLTDDPNPPSDGELLKIAFTKSFGGTFWTDVATEDVANEFRKLLAEREGGAT